MSILGNFSKLDDIHSELSIFNNSTYQTKKSLYLNDRKQYQTIPKFHFEMT